MDDGKRLYGVDLFKALSMLLVVALHINTVGGALEGSAAGSVQWWIADFVQIAAYCCVDCFALATGFLMAGRRFRPGRIVSLWLQVAFYSVVTAIAWYFTVPGKIDLKYIVSSFFPVLTSKYWYFTAYFVLFFFTPFLNAMLRALDTHGRKMLLAAIFVFLSLLPTFRPLSVIPLSGGYCFFWLAALYLIGGCVKLDGLYEKASGKFFVLAYFASVALNINAKVKASVTAICGGKAATSAHIKTADAIFSSVGKVYHIDEDLFPAFGALGGASGAFVLMYIDALAEAGVRAGKDFFLETN